jgi:hypothetical protein
MMRPVKTHYDEDFYAWTQAQAALLRAGKWQYLDAANLAEEIESLGRQDKRELKQRLEALLNQLLTWWAKPEERCGRWSSQILGERHEIASLLRDSPSLQAQLEELLADAYPFVRGQVLDELGLFHLPEQCPFKAADVLRDDFWPESQTM